LQGRYAGWYLIDFARGRPTNPAHIPNGASAAWYHLAPLGRSNALIAIPTLRRDLFGRIWRQEGVSAPAKENGGESPAVSIVVMMPVFTKSGQ
jgi:hypothetical protein